MEKLYRDRDWLREHYVVREESSSVMATVAACDRKTICRWLSRHEIPVRCRGEGVFLAKRNTVIIVPNLLKFMRGEIVGDGHVGMTGNRSANYQHTSKYEKYLIWLSGCFNTWGIEQAGRIRRRIDKQTGAITYNYASRSYPELVPIRQRWYPKGVKIVPKDLELVPIMARQWYIGDGYLKHPKRKRPHIEFNTQAFSKEGVEYLAKELSGLGFKATRQPSSNKIRIWVRSVPDFLKWIGPCPISCYDYKWDY